MILVIAFSKHRHWATSCSDDLQFMVMTQVFFLAEFCSYADSYSNQGTKTNITKQSAQLKLTKYMMTLGSILSQ